MAFEFISIKRNIRKNEQEPNYLAVLKYNNRNLKCELFTNALIMNNGTFWLDKSSLSRVNGNLYFRLDCLNCDKEERLNLEREIRKYVKTRDF
jgi:hypothetical protein